jgi:drug/metabolite transporter (DMT)-like permease
MIGLVFATGVIEHTSLFGEADVPKQGYWLGIAACLIGAFFTACVTMIAHRLHTIAAGVLAWWQCALGSILLLVWPINLGWPAWGISWGWLAGLGLIHTGLAYALLYEGTARLNTGRIAILQFAYPAIAIILD